MSCEGQPFVAGPSWSDVIAAAYSRLSDLGALVRRPVATALARNSSMLASAGRTLLIAALAGRPAGGPVAAEELAPAAVQPLSCLEQALHLLAGGGPVLQRGLDGPQLLDDVLEGIGRRLRLQPKRSRPPATDRHSGQREQDDRGGGQPPTPPDGKGGQAGGRHGNPESPPTRGVPDGQARLGGAADGGQLLVQRSLRTLEAFSDHRE